MFAHKEISRKVCGPTRSESAPHLLVWVYRERCVHILYPFCIRFVSVHSICADLTPYKLFSVRHYTMPCAHQLSLRACVLIKELQTVAILVPRGRPPFGQHQESRPLAYSGQVQHRKSAIHGLPVTLRMLRVKSDKADWLWSQSIVFTKPFKTGMSLDWARGRDSWC